MAKKNLVTWKNNSLGQKLDFDNASYDCVDVSKSWIMYLTGKPWQECAGWGNAKDIYANWYATYLDKIPRGNAPKLGDILVMNGQIGGGYGHTGVVIAIDGRNVQIAQQNTFTQQAVYTGWFDAYASNVTGFLRPNANAPFEAGAATLEPWQRVAGPEGVYYRKEPKRSGEAIELFAGGDVVDFKGFVRGEAVDGNDIWFVGRHTGFYSWSGGYTDSGTHDLVNMTPATEQPLTDTQRKVGSDAMNVRSTPKVDTVNGNVVRLVQPATVIDVKGYTRGQSVDGIDKWFVLTDGTYTWVGGYTNQDLSKLTDLTPVVPPTDPGTPSQPTYPAPTTDPEITKVYNKKHPVGESYYPTDLVAVGNGQTLRQEAAASLALMQNAQQLGSGSGFRSYATQKTLYEAYVAKDGQEEADRYSARPGYSEHQTGLTMDFTPIDDPFKNTPAYAWLQANAHKYGWVLRYPADKESVTGYISEPWHWRYVGVTVATDMKSKGITTLEEYFNVEGGGYGEPTKPTEPEQPKPEDPNKDAKAEAAKLIGRQGLLAAISALIAAVADWVVNQLVGLSLPTEISVALAGVVYAGLLYLDKWIHENAKIKLKGLIPF